MESFLNATYGTVVNTAEFVFEDGLPVVVGYLCRAVRSTEPQMVARGATAPLESVDGVREAAADGRDGTFASQRSVIREACSRRFGEGNYHIIWAADYASGNRPL